jgi:hypothetical protein
MFNLKDGANNGCSQRSRLAEVPVIALLQLGRGVTFFIYAALLKYNRIGEVEMMCSVAGILASLMLHAVIGKSVLRIFFWRTL